MYTPSKIHVRLGFLPAPSGQRQVSRVEELLAEAWQLYRSESRARPSRLPPTSPSLLQPPLPVATQRSPGVGAPGTRSHLNAESLVMAPPAPASSEASPSRRAAAHARGGDLEGAPHRAEAVVVKGVAAVGAPEYLQWLGDMSNMLVHEQWRKEELLSRVDFGPEASSERVRAFVQARWSSRSADSFLDRALMDTSLTAAQVAPGPKAR